MKQALGKSQCRFTTGKSCQTNQISIHSNITFSVNMGRAVDIVYLDFSKAFDTVQTGWVLCEMGKELASRSRSESGGQWFSLRLAACHK